VKKLVTFPNCSWLLQNLSGSCSQWVRRVQ
jgi:hypothetical protein